jgi:type III secretion protein L
MAIGKVIKGEGQPEPERSVNRAPRGGVVNAEIYDAHQSAQNIVAEAQRRATELLEEANRQREKIFAEAREKGRQEGLAQVTETLLRARIQRDEMLEAADQVILTLACKVAEKILGKEISERPELIANVCATAIEGVRNAKEIVLRVNPQDAAILRAQKKQMMEMIGRMKEVAIKEDSDVESRGCVIETNSGTIDAQLSTQLEMIQQVLLSEASKKVGPG